jgi:hypothetical protein
VLVGAGEQCFPADGIGCSEGDCVTTERSATGARIDRCVPIAPSRGTCHRGFPDDCPAGEYCPLTNIDILNDTFTDTCQPVLPAGESCIDGLDGAECGRYLFGCGTSGVCEESADIGEPCMSDAACWSYRCSGATPMCDAATVCN